MSALTALLLAAPVGAGAAASPSSSPTSGDAAAVVAPLPPAPHLRAVRTPTPPKLDGKLDDPVWKLAVPASAFRQKVPRDGAAPTEPTTVRVLYDDTAVYVAFDCPQTHSPVAERLTRRDRWVEADAVSFDLGTRGDHKSAFMFGVNASGILYDGIRFNDTEPRRGRARAHVGRGPREGVVLVGALMPTCCAGDGSWRHQMVTPLRGR